MIGAYRLWPGEAGISPATEATLTMRPNRSATMPGSTFWVSSHTAVSITCSMAAWSGQPVAAYLPGRE